MRYFIEVAYRGTNYSGWQIQKNKFSIQAELNDAVSTVFNEKIACTGAGRTDTGVHAIQSYAHFDALNEIPEGFLKRVNSLLPPDIAIRKLMLVHSDAHARYDATERSYKYYLHYDKDPFLFDKSFFFPYLPLDLEKVYAATDLLLEFKDFAPLSKRNNQVKTTLCDIYKAKWETIPDDKGLIFHISANRFLRGMVRRIVGALLMIGKEKITIEEFKLAMQQKKPLRINISVPPQGLFLNSVKYPYINQ